MVKFKVGDKVRSPNYYVFGDMVITESGEHDGIWIAEGSSNGSGGFATEDLELIEDTPTPDERAVALVRKMVEDKTFPSLSCMDHYSEARAILDALDPVDGDLLIAREMVAESDLALRMPPAIIQGIKSGAGDDTEMMKLARAALARGRQLEKEGK